MGGSGEEEQPPIEEASLTLGEKLHIVLFWSSVSFGGGGRGPSSISPKLLDVWQ